MTVASSVQFIEFVHSFGTRLDLPTMERILKQLGSPHLSLKYIHVAGTNGKGSTSSFLSSMLIAQGCRTGLFTSPHMHCYTERIQINGVNIPEDDFNEILQMLQEIVMPMVYRNECPYPAMFDLMTLMAFVYFGRSNMDYVILEVGLGGLEDATNVITDTLAAVITPIDIDHVDLLGSDLKQIAAHKAGIIKPGRPVVYHYQPHEADIVIRQTATYMDAPVTCLFHTDVNLISSELSVQGFDLLHPLYPMNDLKIRMPGKHQANNAALAALTLLTLRANGMIHIEDEAIRKGLFHSFWAGRLEVILHSPLVIIDGAHNLQGAEILRDFLLEHVAEKRINFLVGMLNNKDTQGIIDTLMPMGQKLFFTRANSPKAVNPDILAGQVVNLFGKEVFVIDSMLEAVQTALSQTSIDEVLVITGSLYLVGDAKSILITVMEHQKEAS
jgi:dihydrofolate synthase / folylpolyglutamate synthase